MSKLSLVRFDADSTNYAGELAFQERGDDGSFIGLYDADGETLASRNSFPRASWSIVRELGEMADGDIDDFWSLIADVDLSQDFE